MARSTFGGRPGDYTIQDPSGTGGVVTIAASQTGGTVWSAVTGGTQYTDLLVGGSPTSTVTSNSKGAIVPFQGPDGVSQVWVGFGGGPRVLLDSQALSVDVATPAAVAVLATTFGSTAGVPIKPWSPEPGGPELWATANMSSLGGSYQTATTTPSLTPNGTGQTLITRVKFADVVGGNEAFRISFDFTTPSNGWGDISLKMNDGSGVQIGQEQRLVTVSTNGPSSRKFTWDFQPGVLSADLFFELRLRLENNSTTGSNLAVSNVSIRQIPTDSQRPLMVSQHYDGGGFPDAYFQQRNVKAKTWQMASVTFPAESALTPYSPQDVTAFYDDQPFSNPGPDPAFKRTTVNNANAVDEAFATATGVSMRINNNDAIYVVWNGSAYEYRGNTHGGEVTRSTPGVSTKIDYGSGLVSWTLARGLVGCRRFQVIIPSELRRSVDGTTPFATVDRTITLFPDGMMRTDKTTTFTQTTLVNQVIEWMSSHNTTVPYIGRAGRGLTVVGEADSHPLVAVPATPGSSTSTSGGTLAAATYSYKVTALTPYGETTASAAKTQVTTGTTSTVTVTWSAVTNATGYKVYGRTAGVERHLVTVAAVTSWVDTGANYGNTAPPTVNTARLVNGATSDTMAQSSTLTWAVWKDPRTGWCYGNIYDRESVLTRSGVTGLNVQLLRGNGIQKNYASLQLGGNATLSITSGTVWTATHWNYVYLPADPDDYHAEIAIRAASLAALRDVYPAT